MSKTTPRRFVAAAALGLAGVMAASGSAVAAPATVPFLCRVPENGVWSEYGSNRVFDVTAPATVSANQRFTVKYAQGPYTLNPTYQKEVRDIAVKINQPAGARLVSLKLTGGSNLGASSRSVVSVNNQLTLRVSGPFYGGTTFELPTVEAVYTAPASGTLVTSAGGTGFEDPGLSMKRLDTTLNEFTPVQCYPDPANPVQLSSTTVS
jgi:dehydratase